MISELVPITMLSGVSTCVRCQPVCELKCAVKKAAILGLSSNSVIPRCTVVGEDASFGNTNEPKVLAIGTLMIT